MPAAVAGFNVAPVKSLGLEHPQELMLEPEGVRENRRFFLVQDDGRLFRGAAHGPLVRVRPAYDAGAERLALTFPDGTGVEVDARGEREVTGDFWGRPVPGRELAGEIGAALSDYAGVPLRVVRTAQDGTGCDSRHPVTLLGDGSVAELAGRVGREIDPRRFRMLIELSGVDPHAEDGWAGTLLRAGEAVIRVGGPVGRCANITHDPDTGERDLDALRAIKDYRGVVDGAIQFGVLADVVEPGRVRDGDAVTFV
ncbi:MAG: MOSC domain-containing protein [Gaiellaceae bacterium]